MPHHTGVFSMMAFLSEVKLGRRWLHGFAFKEMVGLRYSAEEQLTGDLWIDGRPIYCVCFSKEIQSENDDMFYNKIDSLDHRLIDYKGYIDDHQNHMFPLPVVSVHPDDRWSYIHLFDDGLYVELANFGDWPVTCHMVLYYIKLSDQPILESDQNTKK
jgi:hypothetical protein